MKKVLRTSMKFLAIFLSILFIVEILPTQIIAEAFAGFNEPANVGATVEEYQYEESHADILYEDVSKRDEYSKHFRMSDGTYQAVMYEMPVHIEQNGEWRDYDNRLVEVDSKDSGEKELTNTFGDYSVRLSKKINNEDLVSFSKDGYDVSWHFINSKKQSAKVITVEDDGDATTLENLVSEVVYEGVFKNTNLQYFVMPGQLKENIILEGKHAPKEFLVEYNTNGLAPSLIDAKTVVLKDEKGDIKFVIEAPYMTDAVGEASTDIKLALSNISESGFVLTISLDKGWLSAKEREYPVVVDPILTTEQEPECFTSTFVDSKHPNTAHGVASDDAGSMYIGRNIYEYGTAMTYIKANQLPTINENNYQIVEATLSFCKRNVYNQEPNDSIFVNAYRITSDWTKSNLTYNNRPSNDTKILDYIEFVPDNGTQNPYYSNYGYSEFKTIEITDLVCGWYTGNYQNYGIMLDTTATYTNKIWLFSINYTTYPSNRPVLAVSYRNMSGYEDYWSYTSVAAGRNGTASVNNYNGNFIFTQPVTQDVGGNLMPVSISLVYNSNHKKINYFGFGNNMHTNYNLFVQAESNSNIDGNYKYLMHDADGTKHWFYFETSSATTAKDEDGLGYTLDIITVGSDTNCTNARFRITDKDKNKMYFNSSGYLIQIRNTNNVLNTITYSGNKITSITDGAGRIYSFSYIDDYCNKITDPAGRETKFTYSSGCLTSIEFPDNESISLVHTYGSVYMLNKIYDIDGMKSNIAYDWTSAFRVSSISYGDESTGQLLSRYAFTYKQNETTVQEQYRNNGNSQIITTNNYTYQFNDFGQNTGIISQDNKNLNDGVEKSITNESAVYLDYHNSTTTGSASSSKNNKLISESKVLHSVDNLVNYPGFHVTDVLTREPGDTRYDVYTSGGGSASIDTNVRYLDRNALKLSNNNTAGHIKVTQEYGVVGSGYYTFSAYINTNGQELTGNGACIGLRAYLDGNASAGSYSYSEFVSQTGVGEWTRVVASIYLPEGYKLKIICQITEGTTGTVWLDNLQLERGVGASSYNMVENSVFRYGNRHWTKDDNAPFNTTIISNIGLSGYDHAISRNARMSTENSSDQQTKERFLGISQLIYNSGQANDVFSIGAWVKADSAPVNDLKGTGTTDIFPRYEIALHFYRAGESLPFDTKSIKANADLRTWQYVSGKVIAPGNYSYLCFEVIYYNNVNTVSLTGGFCYKEEFGQTYTYDNNGNLVSAVDLANTNSQFAYKSNNLANMVNPSGSDYLYTYNGTNNNLVNAFSTDGLKYAFDYDNYGNTTRVGVKGVDFATSIDTTQSYIIMNKQSSNCFDIKTGTSELVNKDYLYNTSTQHWQFEKYGTDPDIYKIKNQGKYLVVRDGSSADNALLDLTSTNGSSDKYLFKVVKNSDGTFTIYTKTTSYNKCVDSTQGDVTATANNHHIEQYKKLDEGKNNGQKWYLIQDDSLIPWQKIETSAEYINDNINNNNYIKKQTDQAGNTTDYRYETNDVGEIVNGHISSVTNAAGVTTNYTYNSNNDALLSVSSGGMTNSYSYTNDRLTDINVNNGTKYQFEYDDFGRTTSTKVGNDTTYNTLASLAYNERGLLSRQTYGNGDYINYSYDSFDRVTEKSYNNEQYKKHYYYGNDGNISLTTDSGSNSCTRFVYDLVGRVVSAREYSGIDITTGNVISYTDYTYESETNYLTKEKHFSPLGTQNIEYVYGNMANGQMPDQVYSVKWNDVTKLTNSFDSLARLSKRTINGFDTDYTYIDRDNNLTTTLVNSITTGGSNGITHTYTYDALGNITSVYDGSYTTSYEYDNLNQLVRVNDPYENKTHVYTYVNGNITADTVYSYTTSETLGNPISAKQFEYTDSTWSDVLTNVKDVYFDNSRGTDGSDIADSRVNSIVNQVLGSRYDTVDMSSKLFGRGNDRSAVVNEEYPITSDSIGNITGYSGITFNWLGRQLQSLSVGSTQLVTYSYNADGQRIGKNTALPGEDSYNYTYYYNGTTLAGYKLIITDTNNNTQTYNVTFMYDENGEPFGFSFGGNDYYYVRNAQNDIYLIVDSNNQAVVIYQYDAWGNITHCYDVSTNDIVSTLNPYTYRGYFRDGETGLYYLKSRYYFPEFHRFICADGSINANKDILGDNLFAYCSNNPANNCDENGCGKISNWFKAVGNKIKKWLNSVPSSSFTIPSTKKITNTVSGFILDSLAGCLSKYTKVSYYIANFSKNYKQSSFEIKPYGEVSKPYANVGSTVEKASYAIAGLFLAIDIANTWTENNNNTIGERLLKSVCQCTAAATCYLIGAAAVGIGGYFGGAYGVVAGVAITVGCSMAIDYCWDKYYERLGIE